MQKKRRHIYQSVSVESEFTCCRVGAQVTVGPTFSRGRSERTLHELFEIFYLFVTVMATAEVHAKIRVCSHAG